jgi:4-diphosphocytidyl-2-C-methyl-D-erythritol kinase
MRGIGEQLLPPLDLPTLPAVLVNPGVAVPTKDIFAAMALPKGEVRAYSDDAAAVPRDPVGLLTYVEQRSNDLEPPALRIQPVIGDVLTSLRALPGCKLARMSGSGATCFGIFESAVGAEAAARGLQTTHKGWWVEACSFGAG